MTAVALVACTTAAAEPGAPASRGASTPPAGWKQLPPVAAAVGAAAKADGVTIDAVDAWGEPAIGCYAVWLALHGGAAGAPALAEQVLDSFKGAGGATKPAGGPQGAISLDDLVKPAEPEGVLAFAFTRAPYHGRVRAHLGNGRITAIACFGNQREPAACETTCAHVLQSVSQDAPPAASGAPPKAAPGAASGAPPGAASGAAP
jgi:hypothetical protein